MFKIDDSNIVLKKMGQNKVNTFFFLIIIYKYEPEIRTKLIMWTFKAKLQPLLG